MAAHQKKARRWRRTVVFLDESGFMLQPVVRKTWALRGHTPVHKTWARHDRLSVIAAVTMSPRRARHGLYFAMHDANITTFEVMSFVRYLRRHVGRRLTLVWDRLNQHRSAAVEIRRRHGRDIEVEFLPGYAPELNPVEQVWSNSKYADLANNIPADIGDLRKDVEQSLSSKRHRGRLLRAFFNHARLPP